MEKLVMCNPNIIPPSETSNGLLFQRGWLRKQIRETMKKKFTRKQQRKKNLLRLALFSV
jgi:hypothetical protein